MGVYVESMELKVLWDVVKRFCLFFFCVMCYELYVYVFIMVFFCFDYVYVLFLIYICIFMFYLISNMNI